MLSFSSCFVLLLLVLPTLAVVQQHASLTSSSHFFVKGAELLRKPSFNDVIAEATACDVCYHLVMAAMMRVDEFMKFRERRSVRSDEVDILTEGLCDPFTMNGAWIRRLNFFVLRNETDENDKSVHIETRVLKHLTKCKRSCTTIEEMCEEIMNYPTFDDFGKEVAKYSVEGDLFFDENSLNLLRAKFCHVFEVCAERDDKRAALNKLLNDPDSQELEDLITDKVEWLEPEKYQLELTMHHLRKNNSVELFTKQQMNKLKEALAEDDLEAAANIDERIRQLSEQEFREVRRLAKEERIELQKRLQDEAMERAHQEYLKKEEEERAKGNTNEKNNANNKNNDNDNAANDAFQDL